MEYATFSDGRSLPVKDHSSGEDSDLGRRRRDRRRIVDDDAEEDEEGGEEEGNEEADPPKGEEG